MSIRFFKIFLVVSLMLNSTVGGLKAQDKLDSIAHFIKSEMQTREIPGLQISIIRSGKVTMLESYGLANVEHSVPVNVHTLFSINSATKAFTGVAVMQLVEDGKLDLEQPISTYLDNLPSDWQNIPVYRLLDHTSGIPDFLDIKNGGYIDGLTFNKAWLRIHERPLEFIPGEKTSYNQTNYVLLGQVIERLSGMKFEEFVRDRQFIPAGMSLTNFGDSKDVISNKAPTYAHSRETKGTFVKGKTLERTWEEFPELRATAGINTTAEELGKWIIALQTKRLLKDRNSLNLMWSPRKLNNKSYGRWALGWVAKRNLTPKAVASIGGSRSWFYIYPDHDLAVVVLTNLKSDGPENLAPEVAGFYYPELKASNGGNYPDAVITLRAILEREGYNSAVKSYKRVKAKQTEYSIPEWDLTNWAYYELMLNKQPLKAKALFKLMAYLYPDNNNWKEGIQAAEKALKPVDLVPK
ncbi:beta-lactamase family protein [Pedobacter sp. N36a]|uniref:serine hydrolase domain-containing protein n=1 Tax=Pedobacter sp. N36a TaxID=2767996 RepID=UPI001656B0F5|nr:serine hydrolase domain-containing protein [Pedobacter sp. N36a]MBC8988418.1 beta-lactamase family protein [Pedobacter sp. N36a]